MLAPMTNEKDPEIQPQTKVDLDKILVEEIGQFGFYQLKTLALCALMVIFQSWSVSGYVFTTARINTRCVIPECDTINPEFSPSWINVAIPSSGDSLDNCQRFGNTSSIAPPAPGTCPRELFDTNVLLDCDDYVYENMNTVVYDFGLACDEWRRTLIGSMRLIGALTALILTGYISDRWGRRTAFIFNIINTAWLGLIRYWVGTTYIGFIISEFFEAALGSGGFSTAYILAMETAGPKYRVATGTTITTFFSTGHVLLGLVAWAAPYWKTMILAMYLPQFVAVAYIWLMSESVRWYMCKGRYAESEALLQKIARENGKALNPKSLELLRQSAEEEKKRKLLEDQQDTEWLVILVFKHKSMLIRVLVSLICWITTTLIYYGMSINAVNMTGNSYFNYMAVSAAEIPGHWIAWYLIDRIGRKPVLIAAFWLCTACQVAYIFMPDDLYGVSLTVYLIGKLSIAMVVTGIYIFTAELYPTKYRHTLFGFSSMTGRIGSIVAPLTPAMGAATFEELPFVLFGAMALLSGVLLFATPETLGRQLPDTMEDAENLKHKLQTT